ncbi:hypothetical protein VFPFJ_10074 [Purpureocillium lilacinum]|uniref:Uncharacterized protein n=1 Tax=Purpureocillium lilacinum TaxID=33203 RepID=A0A179GJQ7_PURLI|nr:hypothetical protein VFPFJ_10074 [Purpureocillium lilacinum]OAQ76504.1 hypothetical protein VFPBJ_08864 [Purpureocillium lilacinum]OAQ78042.1 hypothetical protein VFPFJ_10074 [Purpureocillium lilacinum]
MRLRLRFSKGPSSRLNSYVRQIRDSRRRGAPKARLRLPRRSAVGPAGRSLVAHLRGTGRQSLRQRGCSNSNMLAAMPGQRAAEKPGQASRGPVVVVVGRHGARTVVPTAQDPSCGPVRGGRWPGGASAEAEGRPATARVCVTQAGGLQRQVRVSDGGGCGCGCRGPRTRAEWSVRARKRWGRMTERENAIPERRGAYAQGGMARDKGWWSPPPALQPTGQASAQWPLQCAQCVRLPAPSAATTAPMRPPPTASPASPAPNVEARPAGPQAAQPAAALLASAPAQSAHPSARLWPGSCWPQPCHPP